MRRFYCVFCNFRPQWYDSWYNYIIHIFKNIKFTGIKLHKEVPRKKYSFTVNWQKMNHFTE